MTLISPKEQILEELRRFPFCPPRALRNGHIQTLYQPLFRRNSPLAIEHTQIPTPDGERLDVYINEPNTKPLSTPLVVIAHGLEGNHLSPYIRGIQLMLNKQGWGSACLVHRSCNGTLNKTQKTYHSGEVEDLLSVLNWFAHKFPGRPLFLVGYSLSGNQVAKLFGTSEERLPSELRAGVAISPPFDLNITSDHIDEALGGVYKRHFLKTLRPKGRAKAQQFPLVLDVARVKKIRTLKQFDDAVTSQLHGFLGAKDYYDRVAWPQYSRGIRRALLVIAAKDDPFSPGSTIPEDLEKDHECLHLLLSEGGGHLGFIAGSLFKPSYWSEGQLLRFFKFYLERTSKP